MNTATQQASDTMTKTVAAYTPRSSQSKRKLPKREEKLPTILDKSLWEGDGFGNLSLVRKI